MKQGETTTIFQTGKTTYVLYPEVYFQFVKTLYNEHDDIVKAMMLAQVKVEDGSVFDFLNMLLGTTVNKSMPMEIGYAQLLDALKMRRVAGSNQTAVERVAKQFGNHSIFPHRSDPSKPIFPDESDQ